MTGEFLIGIVCGLLGLGVAGVARRWNIEWGLIWVASAVPALFLTAPRWMESLIAVRSALFAIMALVGVAGVAFAIGRRAEAGVAPWLLAVSLLGVWATVPDTEAIAALLGVTVAMLAAWRPLRWATPRWPGGLLVGALSAAVVLLGAAALLLGLSVVLVSERIRPRCWTERDLGPRLAESPDRRMVGLEPWYWNTVSSPRKRAIHKVAVKLLPGVEAGPVAIGVIGLNLRLAALRALSIDLAATMVTAGRSSLVIDTTGVELSEGVNFGGLSGSGPTVGDLFNP